MTKLLLLSSIIMNVVIPLRFSREGNPMRALRRTLVAVFAYNVFYWVAVLLIYFFIFWRASPPVVSYGW